MRPSYRKPVEKNTESALALARLPACLSALLHMEETVTEYFASWNAKDQLRLGGCLCSNAKLTDWNISVEGLGEVIKANTTIWQSFPDVKIDVEAIFISETSRVASCELTVYLDGEDFGDPERVLKVVDVLSFSEEQKVCAIRAYKQ